MFLARAGYFFCFCFCFFFNDTATTEIYTLSLHDALPISGTGGLLGNRHAPGTAIIEEEGARHLQTGWPICYTSADSVFQIAAHEEDRKSTRLNSSHMSESRMPSSA